MYTFQNVKVIITEPVRNFPGHHTTGHVILPPAKSPGHGGHITRISG